MLHKRSNRAVFSILFDCHIFTKYTWWKLLKKSISKYTRQNEKYTHASICPIHAFSDHALIVSLHGNLLSAYEPNRCLNELFCILVYLSIENQPHRWYMWLIREEKDSKMDIDTDHVHINIHSADILPYYAVFVLSILKWKQKTFDHYFTLVC